MASSQSTKPPRDGYKPWFDRSILALAHLSLLPLWVLLWTLIPLLVWLGDRGPVFYRQKRAGRNGEVFTVLKFRTMVIDADLQGPAWTVAGDPRVTRFGRLLRRTALDELPELLNIWKGEMSLVGPRALAEDEQRSLERSIPGFEDRLRVRPGLTGLAQVYDHSDDAIDKLRYDLVYVDRMGPFLDSKLILLSVWNTIAAQWDRRSGKVANGDIATPNPGPDSRPEEPAARLSGSEHEETQ
jgi:lipopolysaccharide/colanic/teichoic acid biosynthesis glycosyltransferase